MKRLSVLLIVMILCLSLGAPISHASPEDYLVKTLPDFSVQTIKGKTFALSESLKTHDLVLINVHLISVPDEYKKPWDQLSVWGNEFELTVTLYPETNKR